MAEEKTIEQLKEEAVAAGLDLPEEPSGNDAVEDVTEVEVVEYGDIS